MHVDTLRTWGIDQSDSLRNKDLVRRARQVHVTLDKCVPPTPTAWCGHGLR